MTTLLTIAILLLVSIAVWQITKIFQVAQLNQKVDDSQVANDKDNDWNGKHLYNMREPWGHNHATRPFSFS